METTPQPPVSKAALWTGRVLSAVPVLMLLVSAGMKFAKPPPVLDGFAHLGYPAATITGLGVLEVVCTVAYLVPATSVLGAILVTGYLGGAVASTFRAGDAYAWPLILGILAWAGLYLREPRLRAVLPFTGSRKPVPPAG
jgi:hypothetical protein